MKRYLVGLFLAGLLVAGCDGLLGSATAPCDPFANASSGSGAGGQGGGGGTAEGVDGRGGGESRGDSTASAGCVTPKD